MKTNIRQLTLGGALICALFTTQTASACYIPSAQRWLNRDPIGEHGFELIRSASLASRSPKYQVLWFGGPSLYDFDENNPLGRIDSLGLASDACAQLMAIANYAIALGDIQTAFQAQALYNQLCRPPPPVPPGGFGYERNPVPDPSLNRSFCPSYAFPHYYLPPPTPQQVTQTTVIGSFYIIIVIIIFAPVGA
jgi:hypothetical protein